MCIQGILAYSWGTFATAVILISEGKAPLLTGMYLATCITKWVERRFSFPFMYEKILLQCTGQLYSGKKRSDGIERVLHKIMKDGCEQHCVLGAHNYEKKYLKYVHSNRAVYLKYTKFIHSLYSQRSHQYLHGVWFFMKWLCLPDGNSRDFLTQYTSLCLGQALSNYFTVCIAY